ncbi:MAG: serine aminopeptidase domain-containing protein [Caulobacterales bacterium]
MEGTGQLRQAATAVCGAAALLAACILLAGCDRHSEKDPFTDSRPPPGLAERFYPPEGWAWGLIQVEGQPAQRYGVSAAAATPRAQVLILPGYGETAETWFETARALNAAGAVVWVLEGIGQGGSGRLQSPRDLGRVRSFAGDVAAVRAMAATVIRPEARTPLILLGQGDGALIAARAVETGLRPGGLILSAPDCAPSLLAGDGPWLPGLGGLRAPSGRPWRREAPDAFGSGATHDAWRGAVTHAWQLANPDLRMGGPSLDWLAARDALRDADNAELDRLNAPTLVLDDDRVTRCLTPPGAERRRFPGAGPELELERDDLRKPWLEAVQDFISKAEVAAAPPPPEPHGR